LSKRFPQFHFVRKHKKALLAVILILATISAALAVVFHTWPHLWWLIFRPRVSLEGKVDCFIIHWADGKTITLSPQTPEGKSLAAACEDVISNLDAGLLLMTTDEMVELTKNSSDYVDVRLKSVYNFTFFCFDSAQLYNVEAKEILILVREPNRSSIIVMFDGKPYGGQVRWGSNFSIGSESKYSQQLRNIVDQLRALA
jgi:hypothetical protein